MEEVATEDRQTLSLGPLLLCAKSRSVAAGREVLAPDGAWRITTAVVLIYAIASAVVRRSADGATDPLANLRPSCARCNRGWRLK